MGLDRRTFLQRAGLGLLTLGVSQGRMALGVNRYYSLLAAPTPRKLALLVGINEYTDSANLKGCLADVELQRELLLHRFDFQKTDIVTLKGEQATREAIERAFIEHLIEQATPGDVVIFHFSGYGRQVKIPQTTDDRETFRLANSLVPSDGIISSKGTSATNDILEETLLLLGRSLATDKFTIVLDTSYSSTGNLLQGNLRVRSLPTTLENVHPEALAWQERLQRHIQTSVPSRKHGGTILAAATKGHLATEMAFDGFNAGLFTYSLTQHLWEVAPASRVAIAMTRATEEMAAAIGMNQEPQQISGEKSPLLTYYLLPENSSGAEGVITKVEDDRAVEILLTGLPAKVLEHYGVNSCFSVVASDGEETLLQIRSREGWRAKAKPIAENSAALQPGQLVREAIRILSHDLSLTVALDSSLKRIERVDATSAFASISSVSFAIAAGEQSADCVLGKIGSTPTKIASTGGEGLGAIAGGDSYGLFSAGGIALPNEQAIASEAVKSAIGRLNPQLQQLLAAKWWRLTANEGSSRLGTSATLAIVGATPQAVMRHDTQRQGFQSEKLLSKTELPHLPIGTRIEYQLENSSDRPLYFLLLGIDSSGEAIALYVPRLPGESSSAEKTAKLKSQCILPGDRLVVPSRDASFDWLITGPTGLARIQIVFAIAPFSKTLEALSAIDYLKGEKEQILKLPNPLEVSSALLQDLHAASAVPTAIAGAATDIYALDTKAWATLSFVYQVV
jgi:hypothetical protein